MADEQATDAKDPVESSTIEEQEVAEVPEESTPSEEESTVPQKRLNEVWYQKKAAEREAAALKAELNQIKQTQTPEEQKTPGAPTLEDFDYDQDRYTEAFISHKVKEGLKAHEVKVNQLEQQKQIKIKAGEFQTKAADYAAKNPDYVKAYNNPAGIQYSNHVYSAVVEEGPQMDHYLLNNPMVAERLNNLDPIHAAVEIGKISASFKTEKKIVSNAPPAIEPVKGTGASPSDPRYDPNSSPEEYYKYTMGLKGG
ncbi:MAG: hypothetical protein GY799_16050 [Desulfobulbaceae bacterium]|nr:hypothetical protein [Desulfobulbaceae bacterium]